MDYLYVITSACILTWFRWNQHIQGRSYPFVGISCLYGMWMLANGITIPLDVVTVATLAFALWIAGSIFWSQKTLFAFELFNWFSYLLLFTAARSIETEWAMWILVPNSAVLAGLQIYYHWTDRRKHHDYMRYPLFGNSNHNAAFMIVGFFASLWLAVNVTAWMFPIVLLQGVAIIETRRRGPMLAMIASLVMLTGLMRSEAIGYVALIVAALCIPHRHRIMGTVDGMFLSDRLEIYRDAWKRISPFYLTGRGLNYYRDTKYGRVHNDFLELMGETGIIGLVLFLNIFWSMNLDPIILCAVVAYFIDALFFYPFREQHTAAPFWLLAGGAVGFSASSSLVSLQVVGVLVLIMFFLFAFKVFSNLVEWDLARGKDESKGMDRAALGQGAGS